LGDISADLPSSGVLINYNTMAYQSIVDGQNGLYIIPQVPFLNADIIAPVENGTSSDYFYLEVKFKEVKNGALGTERMYAFPVPTRIEGEHTSIAFEIQRQYTFLLTFGEGENTIDMGPITVDDYDESDDIDKIVVPEPVIVWAGSNIYYDANLGHMTFAGHNDIDKMAYQGVYFKWGSLLGISTTGAMDTEYQPGVTMTFPKEGGVVTALSPAWNDIPYIAGETGEEGDLDSKYLSQQGHNPNENKGDICKCLSDKKMGPPGKWRMPTASEFGRVNYDQEGNFSAVNGNEEGTVNVFTGFSLREGSPDGYIPYFPASGMRFGDGKVGVIGSTCFYWSSSPVNNTNAYYLDGKQDIIVPNADTYDRTHAFPIRCVKEI
jgi:uncharacterized protein (TIGR02145 family)